MKDLHLLPKVRDSWSYLYVEHCRVDQESKAIAIHDASGRTPVPCTMLTLLMLGPGTTITQAAVRTLAENGCLVMWCGEEAVRFYAVGLGETRSSRNLMAQARLWADEQSRLGVVMRMYRQRFDEVLPESLMIEQLRGREGIRVRRAYAELSEKTGVPWKMREYKSANWRGADPINRALSCANSCLYGLCHAAIVAAGFSPALGFVHTGKMLSFVYDVADLYKTEVTIPVAFGTVQQGDGMIETRVRKKCRDVFFETRLLERIVPDLYQVLGITGATPVAEAETDLLDEDDAVPGGLWDPVADTAAGGVNYGDETSPPRQPPGRQVDGSRGLPEASEG
ncbi:MAG TPA: type I-E CRISPR-associated endonuclease Cas1e [Bryobacteraceae bacterium]|nr:type I-E CRISPR-associated endonuclease Cas1e [Bryobacteraceae bacterium]